MWIGEVLASSPVGVRRVALMVRRAVIGSGRSRWTGNTPFATVAPQTVQFTITDVMHSFTAPTATATCQNLSLPLGCVSDTPSEPLSMRISSTADPGM